LISAGSSILVFIPHANYGAGPIQDNKGQERAAKDFLRQADRVQETIGNDGAMSHRFEFSSAG
jgi:hypothetical protein